MFSRVKRSLALRSEQLVARGPLAGLLAAPVARGNDIVVSPGVNSTRTTSRSSGPGPEAVTVCGALTRARATTSHGITAPLHLRFIRIALFSDGGAVVLVFPKDAVDFFHQPRDSYPDDPSGG